MHYGYSVTGKTAHAVDPNSPRNMIARKQGWTDTKTGAPYAESVCGTVVAEGDVPWMYVEGLCCRRCNAKIRNV